MNIISLIQPQELGPDFVLDQGIWKVKFPLPDSPPPISNDVGNIIQNVGDGMYLGEENRLTYALVQDTDNQKILLYSHPDIIEFDVNTAILVSEVDMLTLNGQFDDIAIDEGVVTFTDVQTGSNLTLNTSKLQRVGNIKSTNTVTVTEDEHELKLAVKLDSNTNNLLKLMQDGISLPDFEVKSIFNEAVSNSKIQTQSITTVTGQSIEHVIGDQITSIPKIQLSNTAGLELAMINDPKALIASTKLPAENEFYFTTTAGTLYYQGVYGDVIELSDGRIIDVSSNQAVNYVVPAGKHCIRLTYVRVGFIGLSGPALIELHNFPTMSAVSNFRFTTTNGGSRNLTKVPSYLPPNLTDLRAMFYSAYIFNQDISGWDTSNVITLFDTFSAAYKFNQPIGKWNVSKVTDMRFTFQNAKEFNQDLTKWCVGKITSLPQLFNAQCAILPQNLPVWGTCPRKENIVQ